MAKSRRVRTQQRRVPTPRNPELADVPVTSEHLTKLLARRAPSVPVTVESGVTRAVARHYGGYPIGWSGWSGSMTAPPPGAQVLWVSFSVPWQLYTWNSWGPGNNSNTSRRVGFGISWQWRIVPNPYYFPEPLPVFIGDSGRHEFYTSVPPGGSGFNTAWIAPARTKTLTPDSKESDPTPLQLLLSANQNGTIPLWFALRFSNAVIDGQEARGYTVNDGTGDFYWSYAYVPARVPIIGPDSLGTSGTYL